MAAYMYNVWSLAYWTHSLVFVRHRYGPYGACAVMLRGTAGVQSGYSGGTLRVQLGYSQGTAGVQSGYSQGTAGVQQGYSGV